MARKDNYIRKRDLHAEIQTMIEGLDEPDYIVIEVLKMIISEIKAKNIENSRTKSIHTK